MARTIKIIGFPLLIAIIAASLSLWWQRVYWVDLNPPLCSARRLLSGEDPYSGCQTWYIDSPAAAYPLTTIITFIPFSLLPGKVGAAVLWGVISGLLAYGLSSNGKPHQWLIFLSSPYWIAFIFHQFSPLMAAIMLLPLLLPLALIKPQIGLPVILTNLTRRRFLIIIIFLLLTILVYPRWPLSWLLSVRSFDGVIPLLVLPLGPLLLLALLKYKNKDVLFLFLMACVPQRSLYDLTPLFLLPKSFREILIANFLSWVAVVPLLLSTSAWTSPTNQVLLSLTFIYLPLLIFQFIPELQTIFTSARNLLRT
jgi:hypothetical protein